MKQGTIYIIKCKDKSIKDCYIGSTTNLKKRIIHQKYCCNNPNSNRGHLKLYQFMRDNGGFINFEHKILEDDIEFNNRNELNKIERYYIEEFKSSLNIDIPSRTEKEYRKENREKIKEYYKIRNQTEKRKEYSKMYNKQYREQNKDKIIERKKIKITCECGSEIRKSDFQKHCRSKKHLQYIENNN